MSIQDVNMADSCGESEKGMVVRWAYSADTVDVRESFKPDLVSEDTEKYSPCAHNQLVEKLEDFCHEPGREVNGARRTLSDKLLTMTRCSQHMLLHKLTRSRSISNLNTANACCL